MGGQPTVRPARRGCGPAERHHGGSTCSSSPEGYTWPRSIVTHAYVASHADIGTARAKAPRLPGPRHLGRPSRGRASKQLRTMGIGGTPRRVASGGGGGGARHRGAQWGRDTARNQRLATAIFVGSSTSPGPAAERAAGEAARPINHLPVRATVPSGEAARCLPTGPSPGHPPTFPRARSPSASPVLSSIHPMPPSRRARR